MKAWKDPSKLCPCIRKLFNELLDRYHKDTGEWLTVVETMRDEEMQRHYYNIGASRTLKSKHLPQPPRSLALAFDVAPTHYLGLKAWNPNGAAWAAMGNIGRTLGLEWGGDWKTFVDQPHFQLRECRCWEEDRT